VVEFAVGCIPAHSPLLICVAHLPHMKKDKKLIVQRGIWNCRNNTREGKYTEGKYLLGRCVGQSLFIPSSDPKFIYLFIIFIFII
jgi:hypothetical protein